MQVVGSSNVKDERRGGSEEKKTDREREREREVRKNYKKDGERVVEGLYTNNLCGP